MAGFCFTKVLGSLLFFTFCTWQGGTSEVGDGATHRNLWITQDGSEDKCSEVILTSSSKPVTINWLANGTLHRNKVRIMTLVHGQAMKEISTKDYSSTVFRTDPDFGNVTVSYDDRKVTADIKYLNFDAHNYYMFQAQVSSVIGGEWKNSTRVVMYNSERDGNELGLNGTACISVCRGEKAIVVFEASHSFKHQRVNLMKFDERKGDFNSVAFKPWNSSVFRPSAEGGSGKISTPEWSGGLATFHVDEFDESDDGMFLLESEVYNPNTGKGISMRTNIISVVVGKRCVEKEIKCEDTKTTAVNVLIVLLTLSVLVNVLLGVRFYLDQRESDKRRPQLPLSKEVTEDTKAKEQGNSEGKTVDPDQ